jgi:phosphoribosylformylglycinamidine synthase
VVIEAARNLACVGATPKALVNCLNFGNPEHPEVMWQFSEVVDGMAEACRALGIPVVGGNVSFYNESRGRDIDPTPVVGVVGLIDDLTSVPPGGELHDGDAIVLLGHTESELGGSEWATAHGLRRGMPPAADLDVAAALHDFVREIVVAREVRGVHDVSDGGLAVALAEMAVAGGCGFAVALASELLPALAWFSESTSRVVVAVDPAAADALVERARLAGVPAQRLGTAGGDRLVADGGFSIPLADATHAWRDALPEALGADVPQSS